MAVLWRCGCSVAVLWLAVAVAVAGCGREPGDMQACPFRPSARFKCRPQKARFTGSKSKTFVNDVAAFARTGGITDRTAEIVETEYPDVELSHMYVDNAAMQLVRAPKQFDVMLTGNLFGDILSDTAAMLTGSIGMLPSASMNAEARGLYEPVHGSAPDIAGRGKANPVATILSAAMLLRYSLNEDEAAAGIDAAVQTVLDQGLRTLDIATDDEAAVSTETMGSAIVSALLNS